MLRRITIWITVCFLLSMGVVLFLFALSKDIRQTPGSFLRVFPPHPAVEVETLNLGFNSYYIAGTSTHHVYLGNYTAPLHVLVVNQALTDTQHVRLNVADIAEEKFLNIRVSVDSPFYFLTDGTVPVIYSGSVHDWHAKRSSYNTAYFQDCVPVSKRSFYIRSLGETTRENVLGKLVTTAPYVNMKEGILQKQIDGIFCTDGMMHYNKTRDELSYLYRYRNEFIVMDTNLNVLRRGHTIDTTSQAKIEVRQIGSAHASTISSPARIVNQFSSIYGDLLFVNSALLARNEHVRAHDNAAVIDVYDLTTGEYQFSFYIYNYSGTEKLRMFSVFGERLYALFEDHLQAWNLREKYFKKALTQAATENILRAKNQE